MQSDVASRVAHALGVALGAGEEKRLAATPTSNLAAYDAFLKGKEAVMSRELGGFRKALGFYEQAVALDPAFAEGWAGVSRASAALSIDTPQKAQALAERARQAGEKAVALAPNRPDGYLALGLYKQYTLRDGLRALEEYAKAQSLAPGNAETFLWMGRAEEELGHWDVAVDHFRAAVRLDPRSVESISTLGVALFCMRRYPEALETTERGLALKPADLDMLENRAEIFLGMGDLDGARASLKAAPKEVEPTALVAWVALVDDLGWILDEDQRELLVRLTPSAFDGDQGAWGLCLAQAYHLKGDVANLRRYAEVARVDMQERLRTTPESAWLHARLGLALAHLGKKDEAIREGERGVALLPSSNSLDGLLLRFGLVRIRILLGDLEKAMDELEPLLKFPHFWASPGWLRIDPRFDPLRKNPRFQKMVAAT